MTPSQRSVCSYQWICSKSTVLSNNVVVRPLLGLVPSLSPTNTRGAYHYYYSSSSLLLMTERGKRSRSPSSTMWLERQRKDPYVAQAQNQGLPSRSYFKLQEINELHYPRLRAKSEKRRKVEDQNSNTKLKSPPTCSTLIQPFDLVLDLGAAPGGWSLYASTQLRHDRGGAAVAVDLLSLDETLHASTNNSDILSKIRANLQSNFHFLQGDFTMLETRTRIMDAFAKVASSSNPTQQIMEEEWDAAYCRRPNLVLSDMAANFTGDSLTDALQTINLCEEALAFAAGTNCFYPPLSPTQDRGGNGVLEDGGAFLCKYFACGKDNEADFMNAAKRAFRSVHAIKPSASRKESSEMYLLAFDYNRKQGEATRNTT